MLWAMRHYDRKEILMSDMEMMTAVMEKTLERSVDCERGVLGFSDDGMVGFALIGPDSIDMAYLLAPVASADFHFNLN